MDVYQYFSTSERQSLRSLFEGYDIYNVHVVAHTFIDLASPHAHSSTTLELPFLSSAVYIVTFLSKCGGSRNWPKCS
jgi:hypothetical protein